MFETPAACLNCGPPSDAPRPRFCPACGQASNVPRRDRELCSNSRRYFATEGALWRTLKLLCSGPAS